MINGLISVIVPVYNESRYIRRCVESIINQDFSKDKLEVIFVDGGSKDNTVSIIESYGVSYFRVIQNPKRLVTYALNLGIQSSNGEFIVRMDAHAEYDRTYLTMCIKTLLDTKCDNVGGIAITKGIGKIGQANADILSSKFGVGNSKFRTSVESGFVDTVPFGTFKRETFDKVGFFNVKLPRSEDNDINSRIRMHGGKVFLNAEIKFVYYCRDSFFGLLQQAIKNGNALFLTLYHNPRAMSSRHFIPFLFVISLITMPLISVFFTPLWYVFFFELGLYFLLDFIFTIRGKSRLYFYKFFAYPVFHILYGIGSFIGLFGITLY